MTRALKALVVGILGGALLFVSASANPKGVAGAYLLAWIWMTTLSVGALIVAMVCDACGAVWFVVLRRAAEAYTSVLPALAILFIPLYMQLPVLYPWVNPMQAHEHARTLMVHRQGYLNARSYVEHVIILFSCWIFLAEVMRHWSLQQDRVPAIDLSHRRRSLASASLIPMAFTVTCAAVDWLMSLDGTWTSSIVGMKLLISAYCAGTSAIILMAANWRHAAPKDAMVTAEHWQTLGKLLFVGLVLWAYLAFMQLLVVWMGDMPDEAEWYLPRLVGSWGLIAAIVAILHFALPFAVLISRSAKRNITVMTAMAVCMLIAHLGNLAWLILPSLPGWRWDQGGWRCLLALIAIGMTSWAFLSWRSAGIDPCPRGDPDLPEARAYRSLP